jgi:outer membrane murein-binding lipoprotein Lpp
MRRVRFLLVAAVLMTATGAGAGNRAAIDQPAKAARAKTAKPSRSAKKLKPVKAALPDDVESDEPAAKLDPVKPLPIPANALLMQYQRVGRDLLLLSNERRAQIGVETEAAKLSCEELRATFRSININDAVKTPESRVVAAATLAELHAKIERLRGVALSQDCLNNPLAKECT